MEAQKSEGLLHIYVVSSPIVKSDYNKVGHHHGDISKLRARYVTPLVDPIIHLFLPTIYAKEIEKEFHARMGKNRVTEKKTEWYALSVEEIIYQIMSSKYLGMPRVQLPREGADLAVQNTDLDFGECKFWQGRKKLFTPDIKTITQKEVWELNRPLDEEHVREIYDHWKKEYDNTGNITVFGNIVVMMDVSGKKLIIDGQHRIEALTRLSKICKDLENKKLSVELISGEGNLGQLIEFYQRINNLKPQPKQKLETIAEIMQAIKNVYKTSIREGKKANRPHVTCKRLKDTLMLHDKMSCDIEHILDFLDQTNDRFKNMEVEKIFGSEYAKNKGRCVDIHKKARKLNFFLAMRQCKNTLDWS
jgi:hypothetical protein